MSIRFSFGNGLLRVAVSLAFLGLVAVGTLPGQATEAGLCASGFANLNNADAPLRSAILTLAISQSDGLSLGCSDSVLTNPVEAGLTDDYVALEDSIEMLRVDAQQRTSCLDQLMIGPKVASEVARNPRPNISPPLLV